MRIEHTALRGATRQIMLAAGVDEAQAESVSENLVWCDMVGRHNHGVERLPILLKRVKAGVIDCPCEPRFEHHSPNMQTLHADNGFGHHAGRLAIDRACDLAKQSGLAIVGVVDSNFFGTGAYYVNRAAERGMISLALSNSFPKVAALGGTRAVLGTNPFAFGAPRRNGRTVMVDMSTAAVAGSTIREKISKSEPLAEGIAVDEQGEAIVDPGKVSQGTLLPAAGPKGFGLAILVEILSGVLTGSGMSHQVASMYKDFDEGGHNGHFFMALDVTRWMPMDDYFDRLEALIAMIMQSGPDEAVRIPGEERWRCLDDSLERGVKLEEETHAKLESLAIDLGTLLSLTPR